MVQRVFATKDDKTYIDLVGYGGVFAYVTNNKTAVYAAIEEDLKGDFPDYVYAIDLLLEIDGMGLNEIQKEIMN